MKITIKKISDDGYLQENEEITGNIMEGSFTEGRSLLMIDVPYYRCFHTAVIKQINQDYFITTNSTYSYKLENGKNL